MLEHSRTRTHNLEHEGMGRGGAGPFIRKLLVLKTDFIVFATNYMFYRGVDRKENNVGVIVTRLK